MNKKISANSCFDKLTSDMDMLNRKTHRFNSNENIYNLPINHHKINNIEYQIQSANLKLNENGDIEENYVEEIRKNLKQCENTLPGYMITVMIKRGQPIPEDELYEMIMPKINDLRKPDGSKYKVRNKFHLSITFKIL